MPTEMPTGDPAENDSPYAEVDKPKYNKVRNEHAAMSITGLPTPPATPPVPPKNLTPSSTPINSMTPESTPKAATKQAHTDSGHQEPDTASSSLQSKPLEPIVVHNHDVDNTKPKASDMGDIAPNKVYGNINSGDLVSQPIQVNEFAEYVKKMLEGDNFLEQFKVCDTFSMIL